MGKTIKFHFLGININYFLKEWVQKYNNPQPLRKTNKYNSIPLYGAQIRLGYFRCDIVTS